MWQDLASALNELNKIYVQLIALAKKKHQALIMIDMATLENLLKEEEPLTKRIGELEQKRQKALIHLAVENRTIKKDTPMTKVIESAPTPQLRQILSQLYKTLDQSTHEAKELSDNNAVLIKAAMKAAAYHLNRIGGAQVEPAYGSRGGEVVSHRKNFEFDA